MKIHRYFFWIEDNFIEIYKNGNLEKYEGEENYILMILKLSGKNGKRILK